MKKYFVLLLVFISIKVVAQIDNESNFYTLETNNNYNKNFVIDYSADNDFATDDSVTLQTAIDDVNQNGGGVLTIPIGNYSLSEVNLKSNVHLDIQAGVVIRPSLRADQKNYGIFSLGENTDPIENVSITNSGGSRFQVDLTQNNNPNVTVVNCEKVSNFLLANFDVIDSYTKFSAVIMGGDFYNGVYTYPENGIVKDIDILNAHYGYGTVQTQSAENVLFKDLSGTGGATLRFETGFTGLNNLQGDNLPPGVTKIGGLNDMVGRNISSNTGNCAVMVSPHALHNGSVDVEEVTSVNSGFAVRVEGGFVSNKYEQNIGLTSGTFDYVRIKNITATFGSTAEVKSKHFKHYPSEISNPTQQTSYASNVFIGPSIAGLVVEGNYLCDGTTQTVFVEAPVVANDFVHQPTAIVPSENQTINCGGLSIEKEDFETAFKISSNPASDNIEITIKRQGNILFLDTRGGVLRSFIDIKPSRKNIDLTDLASGIYFMKFYNSRESEVKKIIIN